MNFAKSINNVLIIDPINSRLKSGERMNEVFIESKVSFENNSNYITNYTDRKDK